MLRELNPPLTTIAENWESSVADRTQPKQDLEDESSTESETEGEGVSGSESDSGSNDESSSSSGSSVETESSSDNEDYKKVSEVPKLLMNPDK